MKGEIMKTIKFTQKKGSCQVGYIGLYPDEVADDLIKRKFAVLYETPQPKKLLTKKESK